MTEREQQRLINHRLEVIRHVEEVTGNVARTCRYYGISRPTFYRCLQRYEEKELEGLRDRSSPSTSVARYTIAGGEKVWDFSQVARSGTSHLRPASADALVTFMSVAFAYLATVCALAQRSSSS